MGRAAACNHGTPGLHSFIDGRGRVWTCSVCGHQGVWAKGWDWKGILECKRCMAQVIEEVRCPSCVKKKPARSYLDDEDKRGF